MSDKFVEVTKTSWGSRLRSSITGVLLGFLLFVGAFVVLWRNEGRTNMATVAQESMPISAETVSSEYDGQLVAVTGTLDSSEKLEDPGYLLAGDYIELQRQVEMYAWVEKTDSETETNTGGSSTTTTEYSYETTWTSNPPNSNNFKRPQGHENYELLLQDGTFTVDTAQVGVYTIDPVRIRLPAAQDVPLSDANALLDDELLLAGSYLFLGDGTLQQPQVGDVRIRYRAVPAHQQVTVFGKQEGSRIVPYLHKGKDTLYRAYAGNRDSAIAAMDSAHKTMGWIGRGAGFLMMWVGLSLILGPISTFLDVLPFLSNISRGMTRVITFVIAFVIAGLTMIISVIIHNVFALLVVTLLIVGAIVFVVMRRQKGATKTAAS